MAGEEPILNALKNAVEHTHNCSARLVRLDWVSDQHDSQVLWQGEVAVFEIRAPHTKAKHCYAWSHGAPPLITTILELPPVDSAQSAVKVGSHLQG
jgi:hypothetical protein